ncbi:hypothetical protein GCM10009789_70200 [Kribbella sancticallisti]|uniref:Uncharacterized protein n=1 Tax=Kribbella sancticallisti TaxID=460087 RepID=A0ABP4QBA9_9ACTN
MPESPGAPPVVSRSTTQKVTSRNGVPRSSKLGCTPRIGAVRPDAGAAAGSGAGLLMATTLEARTDISRPDTRPTTVSSTPNHMADGALPTTLSVCVHKRSPRFRAVRPVAVVCITG